MPRMCAARSAAASALYANGDCSTSPARVSRKTTAWAGVCSMRRSVSVIVLDPFMRCGLAGRWGLPPGKESGWLGGLVESEKLLRGFDQMFRNVRFVAVVGFAQHNYVAAVHVSQNAGFFQHQLRGAAVRCKRHDLAFFVQVEVPVIDGDGFDVPGHKGLQGLQSGVDGFDPCRFRQIGGDDQGGAGAHGFVLSESDGGGAPPIGGAPVQWWLGGGGEIAGHPVPAGHFGGRFGQVVRALGLSVLPVEERLLTYRGPEPCLGPVKGGPYVALAVGGHAEQVPDLIGGADPGDHDIGPLAQVPAVTAQAGDPRPIRVR
uniref:Uncharacterized protein n=1 Tax=Arthrobacter sp. Chr15 TaxID=447032 RepID=A6YFS2_9MICC|nr:unknown [Arthrobacter sp. Chr15]